MAAQGNIRWAHLRRSSESDGMNDLLKLAIEGHGGMPRWKQISQFRVVTSITGAIWALKGMPGLLDGVVLDGVVLEGETRDQRLTITPFPQPGQYATWEPYRQTIETASGALVAERHDPLASFAGLTRYSAWDEFQVAYFASEANWNYFVAPFIFARGDFITRETGSGARTGRPGAPCWSSTRTPSWRITADRPATSTTPGCCGGWTTPLTSWAGPRGALPVGVPRVQRGHGADPPPGLRPQPDGSPIRDPVSVAIDVAHVAFSWEQTPCALTSSPAGSSPTTS